jgi:cobalt-zinc-cadmium efflux system outer membrane protein
MMQRPVSCSLPLADALSRPKSGVVYVRTPISLPLRRRSICSLIALVALLAAAQGARANVVPPPTELPQTLSLDEALRIFRKRGLDLLIADAATRSAEGAVKIAGAVPNPGFSASVGNAFTYATNKASLQSCLQAGAVCSPWVYSLGLTDSSAIEDSLSGKRLLRLDVARNALAAAKLARRDAERTIALQVKSAYAQLAQALLTFKFVKDVAETQVTTLRKFQERYKKGAISEGDLERIEVQKLEADQAVSTAEYAVRQARVTLAFLIGVRGSVPDFEIDTRVLDYSVPSGLGDANEVDLLRTAFDHRPDLIGTGYLMQQAEAQLRLTRRQRFPDIALSATYSFGGFGGASTNGPVGPQVLTFGLSLPIPVFYSLAGELKQAEAAYDTNSLQRAKTTAQVVNDVSSGLAQFHSAKALVERMEGPRRPGGGLLQSARGAFEIVAVQYDKGAASLTDYLDALRTYIATKTEYFGDLASYWTSVYQLEAAVAKELR